MAKLIKTSIQLTPELVKWLSDFAEQHNMKSSEILRCILERAKHLKWEDHYVGYKIDHLWDNSDDDR